MRIVPSRLALLAQALPATAVAGLLLYYLPLGMALSAVASLLVLLGWLAARRPRGELRAAPLPGRGLQWYWQAASDAEPDAVSLECDYLGTWLLGLRVDGRRLWLWPDSCDGPSRWRLRRWLVQAARG